jgi:hypothetical protein
LNEHERFMFDKALEMIAAGEPPKYGFTFLPTEAG